MARVTLQEAIEHLALPMVLDTDPPDPRQADLAAKLLAAEAIIVDYLEIAPQVNPLASQAPRIIVVDPWPDDPAAPDPPPPPRVIPPEDDPIVKACILLELGELWRFRGDDLSTQNAGQDALELGHLSATITNLLRRYREPALA